MKTFPIHTIFTHAKAHLDELWAIVMLQVWGEKFFPGISAAKIETDGTGNKNFEEKNGDTFLSDGFLLLGIGSGMFDEHRTVSSTGQKDECTSTLVAKYLGIDNDPALARILKFVWASDRQANCQPFDVASVVKDMNEYSPMLEVLAWVKTGLMSKYYQQVEFCKAEEIFYAARLEEIPINGKTIKMVTAKTDNRQFHKVARANGAGIVIQQQPTRNIQIFTDKKLDLEIYDVVQMIRMEEQWKRGDVQTIDWKELASDGAVLGADMWYFHEEAQNLFNGSNSHPDVEPTRIPLGVIQDIVRAGINPNAFAPGRQEVCQTGVCNATIKNPCPWYAFGLKRCRKIRFEMQRTKATQPVAQAQQ